jgi:hypothetical protein
MMLAGEIAKHDPEFKAWMVDQIKGLAEELTCATEKTPGKASNDKVSDAARFSRFVREEAVEFARTHYIEPSEMDVLVIANAMMHGANLALKWQKPK